jgi:hypothetical protein
MRILEISESSTVLVVEDNTQRRGWFLSRYRIPEAFLADTCAAAIGLIDRMPFDTVFL